MKNAFALKLVFAVLCLVMLALQLRSMSGWNEDRAVYDDVCYLRQAHLFQRFGLEGFDTDIARDDDGWLKSKLKAIGFAGWNDENELPCHNRMPATGKLVIQYPPGPGMVIAMFPAGHGVVPMFMLATIGIFCVALLAIYRARKPATIVTVGLFGCLAIYLMINPIKASYSMPVTAVICALSGVLIARWFGAPQAGRRIAPLMILGLLLGLSVDMRLVNLFLCGGCCIVLLIDFLRARKAQQFRHGALFALAMVAGMAPTLISYWVNTGSPFTSTYYGAPDVRPLDFSLTAIKGYLGDYLQTALLALAIASTIALWLTGERGARRVAGVTAANLAINLAFFLTYPIATPYYTIPISLLSLWTVLFGTIEQEAQIQPSVQGAAAGTIGAVHR